MNSTTAFIALALLAWAGTCAAQPVDQWGSTPVKDLQLQAFFHTPKPWEVQIYAPKTPTSPTGNNSLRVCFTGPSATGATRTDCEEIAADAETQLDSVRLEMLAGPKQGSKRPALVIRATHSADTAMSVSHDTDVWLFMRFDNKGAVPAGSFFKAFHYAGAFSGKQEFVKTGSLAGTFISVWQPFTPGDPVRYRMEVYAPASYGYQLVLSMLSPDRYASPNMGGEPADPIATLMPSIERTMQFVYGDKVPHIAN